MTIEGEIPEDDKAAIDKAIAVLGVDVSRERMLEAMGVLMEELFEMNRHELSLNGVRNTLHAQGRIVKKVGGKAAYDLGKRIISLADEIGNLRVAASIRSGAAP